MIGERAKAKWSINNLNKPLSKVSKSSKISLPESDLFESLLVQSLSLRFKGVVSLLDKVSTKENTK